MPVRLTIEEVKETIEETGCKLLSTEYNTSKKPLQLLCSCGSEAPFDIRLDSFKRGIRCPACREDRMKATNKVRHGYEYVSQRPEKKASACAGMRKYIEQKKHTVEKLKPIFAEQGCELLETEYVDNRTPMTFKCICGNIGKISYKHFKHGERCNSKPCMNSRKEQTNLNQFGAISYTGTLAYNISKEKTSLAKYGVPNPSQSVEVQEKAEKNGYRFKPYILPSGKIVKVQGYEHYAIKELLETYRESDIEFGRANQPELWWVDAGGKRHRYFSDFFIPVDNKVIEVKSTWTLKKGIDCLKIPAIQSAVEEAGYDFVLMTYNEKGVRIMDACVKV
jgi:hypothetical protein